MMSPARTWRSSLATAVLLGALFAHPSTASAGAPAEAAPDSPANASATDARPGTRSGLEIYRSFREGLAQPECEADASTRWRQHFANAPQQLATPGSDVLPLFGYVVDALRAESLPTEYALIPFVESGYRPGARSASGPAGLWQFITITARNHKVRINAGYDGRLSPVDSTTAAVRYLKTLHGMFAGDWRLAVMAYNAGEYRVLGALRRAGQVPASADPDKLQLPAITQAYVRKLHALACLLEESEDRETWLDSLDREVPVLVAAPIPIGATTLESVARRSGVEHARLRRLNPVFGDGRIANAHADRMLLAPVGSLPARSVASTVTPPAIAATAGGGFLNQAPPEPEVTAASDTRVHTVARGESAWVIARRYSIRVDELLARNGLQSNSVLRPGMQLHIDASPAGDAARGVAE